LVGGPNLPSHPSRAVGQNGPYNLELEAGCIGT